MSDTPKEELNPSHQSKVRVFRYMAILFAAAFLLLLLAFLMQNRANQEAISDLTDSVSTVKNVVDENKALRQENAELKDAIERLEQEKAELTVVMNGMNTTVDSLKLSQTALDYFWQLDEAYVLGRYTTARKLIDILEQEPALVVNSAPQGTPLNGYLPHQSQTDNGRFSPYDRYLEIQEALE